MTEKRAPEPERFCWIELATTDEAKASAFYTELLGWGTKVNDGGKEGTYTVFTLGDGEIGGMYALPPEQREQGMPSHWLSYVAVEDVDARAARVAELGGTVVLGPLDVYEMGRMAVIMDPGGAIFAMWQSTTVPGTTVVDRAGTTCWFELMTNDPTAAGEFYRGLFGWNPVTQDMGPQTYTLFMQGEKPAGGMMKITPEMGELPPHWMVYLQVEDCDRDVERAGSLGGQVCVPPMDVPEVGRFSTLMDPTGAAISIIRLTEREGC